MSSEDRDLMDRITSKEGIQELHIVASQVDNELFGSEKERGDNVPSKVLTVITRKLTEQQQSTIKKYTKDHPEVGDTFNDLIQNQVIHSSGVAYTLWKDFDNQSRWDENTQHVWNRLKEEYPDFLILRKLL